MQEQILIIKHGALGDIILASGHLRAIREAHPGAHITCLTGKAYAGLLSACPFIDEIWEDSKPKPLQVKQWLALCRKLHSRRFDWVYDLQTSGRSSRYWWFMPWPKPKWSGIGAFVSHPQRGQERHIMHTTVRLNDQLRIAGIETDGKPDIGWLEAPIDHLGVPARYALVVPGGSAHRPEKRWPVEHYASLCRALLIVGVTPVLIGTKAEISVLEQISAQVPGVLDLAEKTSIAQLATLARGAVWAVGNDTGPMHVIAAANCPSTTIFSFASNPGKSAPNGERVICLQERDLSTLLPDAVCATRPPALDR